MSSKIKAIQFEGRGFIELYLIYNVVLVSVVQQSDSVRDIYFFIFFSIMIYYRILDIVLCAIQGYLVIYFICSSLICERICYVRAMNISKTFQHNVKNLHFLKSLKNFLLKPPLLRRMQILRWRIITASRVHFYFLVKAV